MGEFMHKLREIAALLMVAACLYSQEALTNDSVLKLAKAGMGEDVILGMVNTQPGKYSTDTESVIALKQSRAPVRD
jgi:hypothetical protein